MGAIEFRKELSSYGYHMEIDVTKDDCNRERTPHWHLVCKGRRIGSINIYGIWASKPDVSRSIMKEAEDLTSTWASEISEAYENNRIYGY